MPSFSIPWHYIAKLPFIFKNILKLQCRNIATISVKLNYQFFLDIKFPWIFPYVPSLIRTFPESLDNFYVNHLLENLKPFIDCFNSQILYCHQEITTSLLQYLLLQVYYTDPETILITLFQVACFLLLMLLYLDLYLHSLLKYHYSSLCYIFIIMTP